MERDIAHPPAVVWHALTTADLIKEWLMDNDFTPTLGHRFNFRAEPMYGWNGVADCKVLKVKTNERLS